MTPLSDQDRIRIWRGISRWLSNNKEPFNLSDIELQDAIATTDTWIDSNQASFNNSLPIAARTNMTATQKTLLFCAVVLMRQGINFVRNIFPEVD